MGRKKVWDGARIRLTARNERNGKGREVEGQNSMRRKKTGLRSRGNHGTTQDCGNEIGRGRTC